MRSIVRTETVKKVEIEVSDLLKSLDIDPKKYVVIDVRIGMGGIDYKNGASSLVLNLVERPYETGK